MKKLLIFLLLTVSVFAQYEQGYGVKPLFKRGVSNGLATFGTSTELAGESSHIQLQNLRAQFGWDGLSGAVKIASSDNSKSIIFANSLTDGTGELVRITGIGRIGIGTKTPFSWLSVIKPHSTADIELNGCFNFTDSSTNKYRVDITTSQDTSSFNLRWSLDGNPIFRILNKSGTLSLGLDSTGALSLAGGALSISSGGSLTMGGSLDLGSTGTFKGGVKLRGTGTFSGQSDTVTVTITGSTISDVYAITLMGTTVPSANDALMCNPTATGFALKRNSGGTSGLGFMWIRVR